jgi:hypothetical protein
MKGEILQQNTVSGRSVRSPVLTIMMASRMGENENSRLEACLNSIADTAHESGNVEVLLKFDEDDTCLSRLLDIARQMRGRLDIRYIVTPRAGGYGDLHKAYLDLLRIAHPESTLYWVISDDIELESKGWDDMFVRHSNHYEDGLFVLQTIKKLDFAAITPYDTINSPDPYPIWSKRWVGMQGGLGYVFATDGWTSLLHHRLITRYGIDRCVFIEGIRIKRHIAASDVEGSPRWNGIRRKTHEYMLSPQQGLIDYTAQSYACYVESLQVRSSFRAFIRASLFAIKRAVRRRFLGA